MDSTDTKIKLPHENKDVLYLTDSGLETQLLFKEGFEMPCFASFPLLFDQRGWEHFKKYYRRHAALAANATSDKQRVGFVFESVTWRASTDWLKKLGYQDKMQEICDNAIQVMAEVREEFPELAKTGVLSGNMGPRGDAYANSHIMTVEEAKNYHYPLVKALQKAGADMIMVATLNYINEGIGIALAAQEVGIPFVLSYTLETDGRLMTGESMKQIIETIDKATHNGPAYYMINCAHPTHILSGLKEASPQENSKSWISRIGGVRGNASKLSHAELDNAEELDEGNPVEFGSDNLNIMQLLPEANVFGGCCGTDIRHVESILSSCASSFQTKEGENACLQ
jgi:methionine synthase / methylenetetrahydrofolate reductase(NADPH)